MMLRKRSPLPAGFMDVIMLAGILLSVVIESIHADAAFLCYDCNANWKCCQDGCSNPDTTMMVAECTAGTYHCLTTYAASGVMVRRGCLNVANPSRTGCATASSGRGVECICGGYDAANPLKNQKCNNPTSWPYGLLNAPSYDGSVPIDLPSLQKYASGGNTTGNATKSGAVFNAAVTASWVVPTYVALFG